MSNTNTRTIYKTTDYDAFKFHRLNRPLSDPEVNKFLNKFSNGEFYLADLPVVIDDKWNVIEGQHRVVGAKILGLPVYYKFAEVLTVNDVTKIQKNAAWTTADFARSFAKQGKDSYIKLEKFKNDYKFGYGFCVTLLSGTQQGLKRTGFYDGNFKVKSYTNAVEVANKIAEWELALELTIRNDYKFCLGALSSINSKDYNHKRMLTQLKKYQTLFKRQLSAENYVRHFEEIFNYHRRDRGRFL